MRRHLLPYLANCSLLFTEEPLLRRPAAARAAGFGAVEFWWPFATPVPADREVDAFAAHTDLTAHVQIADAPGRGEPGSGQLDLDCYLSALEDHGYRGWVSLEYKPTSTTEASLAWLPAERRAGSREKEQS